MTRSVVASIIAEGARLAEPDVDKILSRKEGERSPVPRKNFLFLERNRGNSATESLGGATASSSSRLTRVES